MTFISAVVGFNYIYVATDGRATRNGIVIDENCPKMRKLKNNLIIAYSGSKEVIEKIIEDNLHFIDTNNNFSIIGEFLFNKINQEQYRHNSIALILTGINEEGYNQLININNQGQKRDETIVTKEQVRMAFGGSEFITTDKFEEIINDFRSKLREKLIVNSHYEIDSLQRELNNNVARFDPSVNENVKFMRMFR